MKSSLEGLSEHEVHVLVGSEFAPKTLMNNQQVQQKLISLESNIKTGSGLPNTTVTSENPLKVHYNLNVATTNQVPMELSRNLPTAEQLMMQKKFAGASGDIFMTGRFRKRSL